MEKGKSVCTPISIWFNSGFCSKSPFKISPCYVLGFYESKLMLSIWSMSTSSRSSNASCLYETLEILFLTEIDL